MEEMDYFNIIPQAFIMETTDIIRFLMAKTEQFDIL